MTLIFLCIGWLAGVYLGASAAAGAERDAVLQQTVPFLALLAATAAVAALLARDERRLRITSLSLLLAILGIWRAFAFLPDHSGIAAEIGATAVRGTISGRPEPRDSQLQFVLEAGELRRDDRWEPAGARVLVRTARYQEWSYGDRVVAYGELRPVARDSGYWADYLARQGIYSTMEYPAIHLEGRGEAPAIMLAVDSVRGRLEGLSRALLPEPQASLLAGILVGGRSGMPQDFKDALNATSTSHLVAVSGFNVTVVAGLALLLARRLLPRRRAILLAVTAVWAYALLTGLPPSAVRAAVMSTMTLASVLVGRDSDALAFLCFSAALMVGIDPAVLRDLGFQLSFLATAGLVLLEPPIRTGLKALRAPGWLASSLSVTLAAQVATLPVLAGSFHAVSLVAPLANVLVAPALPGLMATGAVAVALGAIAEPLGQVAAPLAWVYLTYLVEVVERTAMLPSASLPVGNLSAVQAGVFYAILLSVALWRLPEIGRLREALGAVLGGMPRWAAPGLLAAVLSGAALVAADRPDGKTHVYFLDVGHGDATLIRTEDGRNVLVDGGPSPTAVTAALGRLLPLMERDLDMVVLTGYGQDRLAGLMEVARRQTVGLVLQPAVPTARGMGGAWAELMRERGVQTVRAEAGQRVLLGEGAYLEVVRAPGDGPDEDPALAVRLVSNGSSVLLGGDLTAAAQREIARGSGTRLDVLRVPAHGAEGSVDPLFAQAAAPRVAMLSVAAGNRFGHPADSTTDLLRGAALYRTDRHGTVELIVDRGGYEVYTER